MDESYLCLSRWMRGNVDSVKSFPRVINDQAAVTRFIRTEVGAPADNHLAGVKNNPVEHPARAADTGLVLVTDECEYTGFS